MKRFQLFATALIVAATLISCTQPFKNAVPESSTGKPVPGDIISDVTRRGGEFTFETVFTVSVNLEVDLYRIDEWGFIVGDPRPADETDVFVFIDDSSGNRIFAAKLDEAGLLNAGVVLQAAPEDMTLTISADGYGERSAVIRNMVNLASVNRVMSMGLYVPSDQPFVPRQLTGLEDRDGDGVPDAYDAFPDDPNAAFEVSVPADGSLSVAFEDLYGRANAGDADYNDFVGAYRITEILNDEGAVTQLTINADAVTKLAGYNHRFGIRIDSFEGDAELTGTVIDASGAELDIDLSVEAPAEIDLFENSRYAVGKSASVTLAFETPQIRGQVEGIAPLSEPPYNPYAYIYNTGHDVHLIGREPLTDSINPDDTFVDGDGFPWALLVPGNWINPDEGQRIETPYPRFTLWRESGGEEHSDWYLHYYDPYVPPTGLPGVYLAGYVSRDSQDIATVWRVSNESGVEAQELPAPGNARAVDIHVDSTGTVLAAGYYFNGTDEVVSYWSDTELIELEVGGRATGITVHDDDSVIYVSGYYGETAVKNAAYWTISNVGVTRTVLHETSNARATGIAVRPDRVVYVSGYYNNGSHDVATYWTDTESGIFPTPLYATALSQANGVDLDGTTVYVSGRYLDGGVNASYWVDAESGLVTLDGNAGNATDIDHENGTTFVVGDYLPAGGVRQAVVWRDGVVDAELATTGGVAGFANGLLVLGGDVYVAGVQTTSVNEAVYWLNGALVEISSGQESRAYAITVVE